MLVDPADSLGEQIQRAFPESRVVKALNTVNCNVIVDPARIAGEHDVFICGNDANAKADVTRVVESFGWPRERVVDLGDISAARGTEAYLAFWIALRRAAETSDVNIKVVR